MVAIKPCGRWYSAEGERGHRHDDDDFIRRNVHTGHPPTRRTCCYVNKFDKNADDDRFVQCSLRPARRGSFSSLKVRIDLFDTSLCVC